jgi:aminomethyltransferase
MKVSDIQYSGDTEIYQIIGGEAVSIDINKGDTVEIIDVEGDQECNVFALSKKGINLIDSLDWKNKPTPNVKADESVYLSENETINLNELVGVKIFDNKSVANSKHLFGVNKDGLCIVKAKGSPMKVDENNSPTEILIKVKKEKAKEEGNRLPSPLGKMVSELRVKKSSAKTYEVKAGEYIQIIDVEGKQCSDFQAFAMEDIKNKLDFCIDPAVTRTVTGTNCPRPGVFNKFYNQNYVPLIEVVQDTIERHDTFAVACNAKYYEDKGFPGHISCTDNFNNNLKKYSIKPRSRWITVNFLWNTSISDGVISCEEESWSRPGDYILLRAITDLVCVSSACPDDTSPVNNWNPTDVHVRIYDKSNNFLPSTAFRPDPQTIPIMTKETGFHKNTKKLTRNFIEYNGYWLASHYNNLGGIKEYWQCREGVAMIDLSPLRKFEVYGPDSEQLMQYALTRNVRKLAVGQVVYSAMCYDNGCMVDDGTLYRMSDNVFRWIGGSDEGGKHLRRIAKDKNFNCWIKSSTDQLHNVAVQGPKSRETLEKIIWTPNQNTTLKELKWFTFTIGRIGGEFGIPVMVSRTGYSGELGYEVFAHPKDCEQVWNKIYEAGKEFNICPLGLDALDMLRIESGLIFAGYEFCDQTDPLEAGIGFTVPLKTKDEDFSGRDALIARKEKPQKQLVGLEIDSNEVGEHGDGVYVGKQQVGIITSATRSPILKKNIALCRISVSFAEIDTKVEIGKLDGHHKRLQAKVVRFPFYDPEKTRVRM